MFTVEDDVYVHTNREKDEVEKKEQIIFVRSIFFYLFSFPCYSQLAML